MNTTNTPPAPAGNSFDVTLREMRHGKSLGELSEELGKLIEAVKTTGKAGSLTYKLTVKPASAGDSVTVQLDDDVIAKIPRSSRGASIFFVTDANTLTRQDPRQREFSLAPVAVVPVVPSVPNVVNN